jgi:hypothetical protein
MQVGRTREPHLPYKPHRIQITYTLNCRHPELPEDQSLSGRTVCVDSEPGFVVKNITRDALLGFWQSHSPSFPK